MPLIIVVACYIHHGLTYTIDATSEKNIHHILTDIKKIYTFFVTNIIDATLECFQLVL